MGASNAGCISTNISLHLGNDTRKGHIVTTERQCELLCGLSDGTISNDLE